MRVTRVYFLLLFGVHTQIHLFTRDEPCASYFLDDCAAEQDACGADALLFAL